MSRPVGKAVIFVAALGAASLAGVSAQAAATHAGNACVFSHSIQGFRALDRNKLVIWAPGRRTAYLVELSMPFGDLKFANQIAVIDRDHNGQLCGYGMDRIVVDAGLREASTVMGVTRLDDAGLEALERQYGVTLSHKKSADGQRDDQRGSQNAKPPASGSAQ
jgi:Family of unknown function (DUF6491)